jgi:hypothetical protein
MKFALSLFFACASAATLRRRVPSTVPSFAVDYAPVAYLSARDKYLPSDISGQLANTQPEVNFTVVSQAPNPLTLNNLDQLNNYGNNGDEVYLTSKDDVETNPAWLYGVAPNSNGRTQGATSAAVVVNDHGDGVVDVFYFYFYAFDFGGVYFGLNIGNHVGDWEHTMVRFENKKPQAIWYSQHSNGQAFTYNAVKKYNDQRVSD